MVLTLVKRYMAALFPILVFIVAALLAAAVRLRTTTSKRNPSLPESAPLLQETQWFSAPPLISEDFNLAHARGSVVARNANTFAFNTSSTLQTFNPLREDTNVHFDISLQQLPSSAELLIGFCPLTYTEDPASLMKLSLILFNLSQGQAYLRGVPAPLPIPTLSPGDTLTCLLTVQPEIKVALSINGAPGPEFFPTLDSCIWSLKQVYSTLHATQGVQLSYSVELSELEANHLALNLD